MLAFIVSTAAIATAQVVPQGYFTDGTVQKGMIVKIKDGDGTKVVPLNNATITKMLGVVVAANDAPVTLTQDIPNGQQVFVTQTGHYDVLVSTQGGDIKAGDLLTISSLDGIGMKATSAQSVVLGKALAGFDGQHNSIGSTQIKTSSGNAFISIGRIPVEISISHNPLAVPSDSNIPGFLQKSGQFVAKKAVNPARLYAGLVILLATFIVAGALLYGGVRSSLTAIGRNPLAKKTITRNLIEVIFSSVIVFVIGLVGVYLILKL
jgi:hypothetical protein